MLKLPLKGVIPPLVTPLKGRDQIDLPALERIIEHVLAGGVHGLFLLGTTGEGPSLSPEAQRTVVKEATKIINKRVPVLVGITDSVFSESVKLAHFAAECGADAVVLAPPYYFPMHQSDLRQYCAAMAREVPLPLFLYNMPSHCKVTFEVDTVKQLLQEPNIVGFKDSSAQMLFFNSVVRIAKERPEYAVLMGPEELMGECVLMGGHGGVCGGANLSPRMYVDMYDAAVAGDLRQVNVLQQRMLRLSSLVYSVGIAPSSYLTGLKAAMSMIGLCEARLSEPLTALPADRRATLSRHLTDLGMNVVNP
ncbi:MAG: dihydrodipicolinate synthase family protein [Planctomycetaceae bacterium]